MYVTALVAIQEYYVMLAYYCGLCDHTPMRVGQMGRAIWAVQILWYTSRGLMEGINMEKSSQGCYKAMQLSQ